MPMPAKRSNSCDLKQIPDITMGHTAIKTVSLFEQKRLRGFWPVYNEENGQRTLTVSYHFSVSFELCCAKHCLCVQLFETNDVVS